MFNHLFKPFAHSSTKTIKKSWLVSVLYLSFIPVLMGCFLYYKNNESFKNQTIYNNEVLLDQIKELIDGGLYDVKTIGQKIASDSRLYELRPSTQFDINNTLLKNQFITDLNYYTIYSSYIKDIYVYLWDMDQFISSKTTAGSDMIYLAYHNNMHMDYATWLGKIKSVRAGNTVTMPFNQSNNNTQNIANIRSLPYPTSADVRASVIMLIDNNVILNMTNNILKSSGCSFNIMFNDSKSTLFTSNYTSSSLQSMRTAALGADGISRISLKDGTVVSFIKSNVYDITYILSTPAMTFSNHARRINVLFFISLLIIIIGGILISIWFIYRNYTPMKEIINMVRSTTSNDEINSKMNEYAIIKSAILQAKNENEDNTRKLQILNGKLEFATLSLLFQNSFLDSVQNKERIKELHLHFDNDYFMVALFSLMIGPEKKTGQFSVPQSLFLAEQLENRFHRENDAGIAYYILQLDAYLIVLFNVDAQQEYWDGYISTLLSEFQNQWSLIFEDRLLSVKSNCHYGLESISDAYFEAKYSMNYRSIFGIDLSLSQNKSGGYFNNYFYPPEEDTKLFNTIVSGNDREAVETLKNIWLINTQKNNISDEFLHCLLYDITGTAIRALNMTDFTSASYMNFSIMIKKLVSRRNMHEVYAHLQNLIERACEICALEHETANKKLKEAILQWIEDNYRDSSLSVEKIGDIFGKSRTFLFSLFKEETGSGLLYHINKVRIEHSKLLLENNHLNIEETAAGVGFNSALTFTRTFKNLEKITPGQYRSLFLQAKK